MIADIGRYGVSCPGKGFLFQRQAGAEWGRVLHRVRLSQRHNLEGEGQRHDSGAGQNLRVVRRTLWRWTP